MFALHATTASGDTVDHADTLNEALELAKFYVEDPRDDQAPAIIFLFDEDAGQFCGWYRRRVRKAG